MAGAASYAIGESMLQGQSYQRRSSEGTNIISFAYLFFWIATHMLLVAHILIPPAF
jgi:hypothetical protein